MEIPNGYGQLSALYTDGSAAHSCMNSFGVAMVSTPTQEDIDAVSSGLGTAYRAVLNSGSRFDGVRLVYNDGGDMRELVSTNGSGSGGRGSPVAPPQVQGLITKRTALIGRKFRGRLFIADIAEGNIGDSGNLNSTEIGLLEDIADAWLVAGEEGSGLVGLVLLHNDATTPTEITQLVVSPLVATLRRRFER